MKRFLLQFLFLFFISFLCKNGHSQNIKGVGILGVNLSQIEGDRVFSWTFGYNKVGLNIGLGANIPISKKFSANIETLYSQLGSYQGAKYEEDTFNVMYKAYLDYLEVPVYLNFFDAKGKMNFGAGFIFGRMVGWSEMVYDKVINYSENEIPWNRWDYRWLINFYVGIYKNIKLNFRYSYSISPIRYKKYSDGEIWEQNNQVFTIRLMWIWNEKNVKQEKK